ncbi:MAG: hypothetical protein MAG451_02046 [Anaerolineales bacterium]|nr:hypothetical protein [Anaerolineales bacterium]
MIARSRIHFPLMAPAMLALLAAMWAGLVRLGWALPALSANLTIAHGPLMVSGFLGTLISLERAVALRRRWMYAAPALTGLGALALIAGPLAPIGPVLITLGSLILIAIFAVIVRQQPALFTITMGWGALAWLVGNGLWLAGQPIYSVVHWWAGFLVLTIAGERLELARLSRLSRNTRLAFLGAAGVLLAGYILTTVAFDVGTRLVGLGMIVLALWLLRYDIARRTVRQTGLTRFIAVCLLSGYVWLALGGVLTLLNGGVMAGPHYDAILHTVFLGFAFAMIFGHAPVILPAVLGLPLAFHPVFYTHLGLLHASLALRILGDLAGWWPARQWGGMFNVFAVLLFLANTAYVSRRSTPLD